MSRSDQFPKTTEIPGTPVRLEETIEPENGSLVGFHVCVEYEYESNWLKVACIHHDERIHKAEPNIYDNGICLRYYQDDKPHRETTVQASNKLDGRPIEECLEFSYLLLENHIEEIIRRFEEWHEIKSH